RGRHPGPVLVRDPALAATPAALHARGRRLGGAAGRSGPLVSASASFVVARRAVVADYLELTKPRITLMVMMTALVGYVMGARGPVDLSRLALALAGTGLVAGGASALNMLLERRTDALMLRTRNRPIPAVRLRGPEALVFGLALTLAGLDVLRFGA